MTVANVLSLAASSDHILLSVVTFTQSPLGAGNKMISGTKSSSSITAYNSSTIKEYIYKPDISTYIITVVN